MPLSTNSSNSKPTRKQPKISVKLPPEMETNISSAILTMRKNEMLANMDKSKFIKLGIFIYLAKKKTLTPSIHIAPEIMYLFSSIDNNLQQSARATNELMEGDLCPFPFLIYTFILSVAYFAEIYMEHIKSNAKADKKGDENA